MRAHDDSEHSQRMSLLYPALAKRRIVRLSRCSYAPRVRIFWQRIAFHTYVSRDSATVPSDTGGASGIGLLDEALAAGSWRQIAQGLPSRMVSYL
jgi:hypothetical protein